MVNAAVDLFVGSLTGLSYIEFRILSWQVHNFCCFSKALQVFYGTYMATEVAYYTYIYATIDRKHYQKVTGFTRSATLSGRFFAGVTAQLLISFHVMNLRQLNYITLACKSDVDFS